MPLPLQSFQDLVDNQAAAILSSSTDLVDFQDGSVLKAIIESNAGNSIWIQALISSLLAAARLQTSSGNEVDTFINAYGNTRKPASQATGSVTFSRTITTSISYIPASTTLVSASSLKNVVFTTYIDTTNPAYDPTTNSYLINTGISSVTVPVQCNTAGTIGNVLAGQIDTINSALVNVNSVTNGSDFTNGANIASDAQAIAGFPLYLAGLSKATYSAIASAVANVAGVTRYTIVENQNESGATQLGYFYVVIDNGLGTIPDNVKANVQNAVSSTRGLAIQWNVDKATANLCSGLTATVYVPAGTTTAQQNQITANLKQNVQNFLATLPIGGTWYFSRVFQLIYDASPLILDVIGDSVLLNGDTIDFESTSLQVPTINPSTIVLTYQNP